MGAAIDDITELFYGKLFEAHPELIHDLFNRGNQNAGLQKQALAGNVWRPWTVTAPVILASAGIGCTPMLSMLEHLADTAHTAPVAVLHADRSPADIHYEVFGPDLWLASA